MLTQLVIRNYALIERLELRPHPAFNVITGETGAGKSIIMGAIGLLLGSRADKRVLFNENEKCVVEATFDIGAYNMQAIFEEYDLDYEPTVIIRREVASSGKSRAFISDTPITLEVLQTIGSRLLDVHSQHDNLLLGSNEFQLRVVDAYAQHSHLLLEYQETFYTYQSHLKHYQKLISEAEGQQKELDYNQFLLEELNKAQLKAGEQEEFEQTLALLENAEEIKLKLAEALTLLEEGETSTQSQLRTSQKLFEQLSEYGEDFASWAERLDNMLADLKDLIKEIDREYEKTEHDPEAIQRTTDRLNELANLQKKHKVGTVEELIDIRDRLEEQVSRVLNFDEEIQQARQKVEQAQGQVQARAARISARRLEVLVGIEQDLSQLFAELGMPNATIRIVREEIPPSAEGIDKINFLFSANKGIAPQEIKNVASGGEFSRLMLAIKYVLAGKTALPTLIFDEIDTGISGEVALKVGKMMKEMSAGHQIIAISHLHQIAAKGDTHYFVYKEDTAQRTFSRIKELSSQERIREIAQMISGMAPSESAIQSAKELLGQQ